MNPFPEGVFSRLATCYESTLSCGNASTAFVKVKVFLPKGGAAGTAQMSILNFC